MTAFGLTVLMALHPDHKFPRCFARGPRKNLQQSSLTLGELGGNGMIRCPLNVGMPSFNLLKISCRVHACHGLHLTLMLLGVVFSAKRPLPRRA